MAECVLAIFFGHEFYFRDEKYEGLNNRQSRA